MYLLRELVLWCCCQTLHCLTTAFCHWLIPIYLCVMGTASGYHMIYGTQSAWATLSGSSIRGKPLPVALLALSAVNAMLLIPAVIKLGNYYETVEAMSDKDEMRNEYWAAMGL